MIAMYRGCVLSDNVTIFSKVMTGVYHVFDTKLGFRIFPAAPAVKKPAQKEETSEEEESDDEDEPPKPAAKKPVAPAKKPAAKEESSEDESDDDEDVPAPKKGKNTSCTFPSVESTRPPMLKFTL
jgi:hypothetical protein